MTPAAARVAPGRPASFELRVRNTGTVVDELTFEPLGDAAAWVSVEPPVLPLFPGAEETVRVTVTPPRASTTPPGPTVFAVRAASREDPAGSAVAEATLEVEAFTDLFAELVPRTARGRRKGTTDLAVDNRGNQAVALALSGGDADGALQIALEPPALTAEPGTATFSEVVIRPAKRFWRGPSKTLPFQLIAERGDGGEPLVVDGTMVQEAVLPKWLLRMLLLLLLLLLLLVPIWFAFLKPNIESTAKEAARDAAEEEVAAALEEAGGGGGGGGGGGDETTTTTVPTTATTLAPGGAGDVGEPLAFRLDPSAGPGGSNVDSFTVPAGQLLRLTDIVLQNPQGDTGRLEVRRDGDVLLTLALQNFRDIDYHFVAPILFTEGSSLQLSLVCDAVTAPSTSCRPSGSFVGFLAEP